MKDSEARRRVNPLLPPGDPGPAGGNSGCFYSFHCSSGMPPGILSHKSESFPCPREARVFPDQDNPRNAL